LASEQAPPLYVGIVREIERQRDRLRLTIADVEAVVGLGEGQYAKVVNVNAAVSARRATWPLMQAIIDGLFGGVDIKLRMRDPPPVPPTPRQGQGGSNTRRLLRGHMVRIAQLRTTESRRQAMLKLPRRKRRAMAKHAAEVRWARIRAAREKAAAIRASARLGVGSTSALAHRPFAGDGGQPRLG
jgi:hypothetical protein